MFNDWMEFAVDRILKFKTEYGDCGGGGTFLGSEISQ